MATNHEKKAQDQEESKDEKPIADFSDQELAAAVEESFSKRTPFSWSDRDFKLYREQGRRLRKAAASKLEALQAKDEFVLEDWIRFLAETVVDIYQVEKLIQYRTYYAEHLFRLTAEGLGRVNDNVCQIPDPYPPYAPPEVHCQCDARLLMRIAQQVGVSPYDF